MAEQRAAVQEKIGIRPAASWQRQVAQLAALR
jgi:hypothetical protein